ncbi:hypothetical protein BCEP27_10036 [Burkholderia cepacia]
MSLYIRSSSSMPAFWRRAWLSSSTTSVSIRLLTDSYCDSSFSLVERNSRVTCVSSPPLSAPRGSSPFAVAISSLSLSPNWSASDARTLARICWEKAAIRVPCVAPSWSISSTVIRRTFSAGRAAGTATAAAGTATGDEDGVEGRSLTASEFLSSNSGFMWLPRFLFCFLLRVVVRAWRASAITAVLSHGRQTDNKWPERLASREGILSISIHFVR